MDYEDWLKSHGIGTVEVETRERNPTHIKLFLDDLRPCPVGFHVARSVAEAIDLVLKWTVTEMSLDHDLGACKDCQQENEELIVCPHVPNGMDFVDWLVATGQWPTTKPTVHSMNPVGRPRMEKRIDEQFPG